MFLQYDTTDCMYYIETHLVDKFLLAESLNHRSYTISYLEINNRISNKYKKEISESIVYKTLTPSAFTIHGKELYSILFANNLITKFFKENKSIHRIDIHKIITYPKFKPYVITNMDCSVDLLEEFINDDDFATRTLVAYNKNCTYEMFEKLSKDKSPFTRGSTAVYGNCPTDIITRLSGDHDEYVRRSVGFSPNCPDEVFKKLSNDAYESVRFFVASNSNCPVNILKKLSKDKNNHIRVAASIRLQEK